MTFGFVSAAHSWDTGGRAKVAAKLMDDYLLASEAASRCARLQSRP